MARPPDIILRSVKLFPPTVGQANFVGDWVQFVKDARRGNQVFDQDFAVTQSAPGVEVDAQKVLQALLEGISKSIQHQEFDGDIEWMVANGFATIGAVVDLQSLILRTLAAERDERNPHAFAMDYKPAVGGQNRSSLSYSKEQDCLQLEASVAFICGKQVVGKHQQSARVDRSFQEALPDQFNIKMNFKVRQYGQACGQALTCCDVTLELTNLSNTGTLESVKQTFCSAPFDYQEVNLAEQKELPSTHEVLSTLKDNVAPGLLISLIKKIKENDAAVKSTAELFRAQFSSGLSASNFFEKWIWLLKATGVTREELALLVVHLPTLLKKNKESELFILWLEETNKRFTIVDLKQESRLAALIESFNKLHQSGPELLAVPEAEEPTPVDPAQAAAGSTEEKSTNQDPPRPVIELSEAERLAIAKAVKIRVDRLDLSAIQHFASWLDKKFYAEWEAYYQAVQDPSVHVQELNKLLVEYQIERFKYSRQTRYIKIKALEEAFALSGLENVEIFQAAITAEKVFAEDLLGAFRDPAVPAQIPGETINEEGISHSDLTKETLQLAGAFSNNPERLTPSQLNRVLCLLIGKFEELDQKPNSELLAILNNPACVARIVNDPLLRQQLLLLASPRIFVYLAEMRRETPAGFNNIETNPGYRLYLNLLDEAVAAEEVHTKSDTDVVRALRTLPVWRSAQVQIAEPEKHQVHYALKSFFGDADPDFNEPFEQAMHLAVREIGPGQHDIFGERLPRKGNGPEHRILLLDALMRPVLEREGKSDTKGIDEEERLQWGVAGATGSGVLGRVTTVISKALSNFGLSVKTRSNNPADIASKDTMVEGAEYFESGVYWNIVAPLFNRALPMLPIPITLRLQASLSKTKVADRLVIPYEASIVLPDRIMGSRDDAQALLERHGLLLRQNPSFEITAMGPNDAAEELRVRRSELLGAEQEQIEFTQEYLEQVKEKLQALKYKKVEQTQASPAVLGRAPSVLDLPLSSPPPRVARRLSIVDLEAVAHEEAVKKFATLRPSDLFPLAMLQVFCSEFIKGNLNPVGYAVLAAFCINAGLKPFEFIGIVKTALNDPTYAEQNSEQSRESFLSNLAQKLFSKQLKEIKDPKELKEPEVGPDAAGLTSSYRLSMVDLFKALLVVLKQGQGESLDAIAMAALFALKFSAVFKGEANQDRQAVMTNWIYILQKAGASVADVRLLQERLVPLLKNQAGQLTQLNVLNFDSKTVLAYAEGLEEVAGFIMSSVDAQSRRLLELQDRYNRQKASERPPMLLTERQRAAIADNMTYFIDRLTPEHFAQFCSFFLDSLFERWNSSYRDRDHNSNQLNQLNQCLLDYQSKRFSWSAEKRFTHVEAILQQIDRCGGVLASDLAQALRLVANKEKSYLAVTLPAMPRDPHVPATTVPAKIEQLEVRAQHQQDFRHSVVELMPARQEGGPEFAPITEERIDIVKTMGTTREVLKKDVEQFCSHLTRAGFKRWQGLYLGSGLSKALDLLNAKYQEYIDNYHTLSLEERIAKARELDQLVNYCLRDDRLFYSAKGYPTDSVLPILQQQLQDELKLLAKLAYETAPRPIEVKPPQKQPSPPPRSFMQRILGLPAGEKKVERDPRMPSPARKNLARAVILFVRFVASIPNMFRRWREANRADEQFAQSPQPASLEPARDPDSRTPLLQEEPKAAELKSLAQEIADWESGNIKGMRRIILAVFDPRNQMITKAQIDKLIAENFIHHVSQNQEMRELVSTLRDWVQKARPGHESTRDKFLDALVNRVGKVERAPIAVASAMSLRDSGDEYKRSAPPPSATGRDVVVPLVEHYPTVAELIRQWRSLVNGDPTLKRAAASRILFAIIDTFSTNPSNAGEVDRSELLAILNDPSFKNYIINDQQLRREVLLFADIKYYQKHAQIMGVTGAGAGQRSSRLLPYLVFVAHAVEKEKEIFAEALDHAKAQTYEVGSPIVGGESHGEYSFAAALGTPPRLWLWRAAEAAIEQPRRVERAHAHAAEPESGDSPPSPADDVGQRYDQGLSAAPSARRPGPGFTMRPPE